MVKKLISKKGIFFTALLVMMSATLLTLAILLFHNSLDSEKRFVELSGLDTNYNLYSSIENSIMNIFLYETGRNYSFSTEISDPPAIFFLWSMNTSEVEDILQTLTVFEHFVKARYDFFELNVSINNYNQITVFIDVNNLGSKVRNKRMLIMD